MPRYFLEVSYKGTAYSGFQSQQNTDLTIQAEVEKAILVLEKKQLLLTGSSRTDAGVHAIQNYFHFDADNLHPQFVYKLNAILPGDIVIKRLVRVKDDAHCRFDAVSREYKYFIYRHKDPFLRDRAFYFPYKLNWEAMKEAAGILKEYTDFTSFSKRNTQVKTFQCQLMESEWLEEGDCLVYRVRANRFLRGMVRALTATMLKVGREKLDLAAFRAIIEAKDCTVASFAVPPQGLFLEAIGYPAGTW